MVHETIPAWLNVVCARTGAANPAAPGEVILWAWVLTIAASGLVAYCLVRLARSVGWLG